MSYKTLYHYSPVFLREDFTNFSDFRKIQYLLGLIRNQTNNLSSDILVFQTLVNVYLKNLKSFYDWLAVENVADIDQGYHDVLSTLLTVIQSAKGVRNRKVFVTSQVLRRLKRNFIGGLSKIKRGLDIIFTEGFLVNCNVESIQIVRYIINQGVGLGDRYRFNTSGRHAFLRKAEALNKNDVIGLLIFMRNPGQARKDNINGWLKYGRGLEVFRVLFLKGLRRNRIYYLFRTDREHDTYVRFMRDNSPNNVKFVEAA
jgi:hypothetical protein